MGYASRLMIKRYSVTNREQNVVCHGGVCQARGGRSLQSSSRQKIPLRERKEMMFHHQKLVMNFRGNPILVGRERSTGRGYRGEKEAVKYQRLIGGDQGTHCTK